MLLFVILFLLFYYYFPCDKGMTLHLKKRKSPLTKDDMRQVWLKLTYVVNVFYAIALISPLGKGCGPSFEKLESHSPNNALCKVWLKLAFVLYLQDLVATSFGSMWRNVLETPASVTMFWANISTWLSPFWTWTPGNKTQLIKKFSH